MQRVYRFTLPRNSPVWFLSTRMVDESCTTLQIVFQTSCFFRGTQDLKAWNIPNLRHHLTITRDETKINCAKIITFRELEVKMSYEEGDLSFPDHITMPLFALSPIPTTAVPSCPDFPPQILRCQACGQFPIDEEAKTCIECKTSVFLKPDPVQYINMRPIDLYITASHVVQGWQKMTWEQSDAWNRAVKEIDPSRELRYNDKQKAWNLYKDKQYLTHEDARADLEQMILNSVQ